MKKLLFILIVSISTLFADIYDNVARNFIAFNGKSSTIISKEPLKFKNRVVGYLFELDRGYILVSKTKSASPIKAYSFKNSYKELPKAYKEFILRELYNYASINTREIRKDIAKRWSFLENYRGNYNREILLRNSPILIKTQWNQYQPYNKFLPTVNGKHVVTGCVQVAMAQIMAYWQYPKMGKDKIVSDIKVYDESGSYVRTDRLTAHLHRKFGWGIMPINAEKAESYQQDAVAYLFRDILIANRAIAGIAGTGTAINIDSLIKNFGYSKNISQMGSDNPNFKATIHSQIDKKMPILVAMNGVYNAGHMAIIDGYKDDNTGNYVHLNLGWGGLSDDYYNLEQENDIGPYRFSKSMSIYYNIKPCSVSNGDCFVNLEEGDSISGDNGSYKISGKFNQERDADEYQVYLKGQTVISGTRGYSNQAFFISIFNSKGELIADDNEAISINLKPDLYTVRVSLASAKSGNYYALDTYNQYSVEIDSNSLTQTEMQSISGNQNSLYIGNLRDIVISKPTKLFIYAYSDNDSDNPTLSANYDSSKIALSIDNQNSLISIKPKSVKTLSSVKVYLRGSNTRDTNSLVSKEFNVITYNKPIYFGKDFSYTGKFSGSYDEESQEVILDGTCKISGYRSYYRNIYYFKLLTEDGVDITDLKRDEAVVSNLRFARYKILSKANGIYDDKSSHYTVYIKCANANYTIDRVAKLLGVSRDSSTNTNTKTDDSTNSKVDDSTKTDTDNTNSKTDDSTTTGNSNNNSNDNSCAQVITHAYNPQTGEEKDFSTPCDVPKGWVVGRAPDFDGDGINDIKDSDDDNDGISDIDENRYGLNPKDPNDAYSDNDGDGYSNIDEINSGTDPNDASSYPNSNYKRAIPSDFNGDGISDIFARLGSRNYILYMDTYGNYQQRRIRAIHKSFKVAGIGDFNGDGVSDILFRRVHQNIIWYMNPDGTIFKQRRVMPVNRTFKVVGVGDFNGDGVSDILFRRGIGNYILYIYNNGTAWGGLGVEGKRFKVATIGDFNGDGISDILWKIGNRYRIWYIMGDGTYGYYTNLISIK